MMRLPILFAAVIAVCSGFAHAQVGEALQRPALMVKDPQRTVLVAAALAGTRIVAVGERGIVILSDDRGAHWYQVACPVSVTLTMVRFVDDKNGVAVGHGGAVLTTSDAGATWTLRLDGKRLAALAKATAKTIEEQRVADRLVADGPDKPFLDVLMWDAKKLLAVGAYGLAYYSSDAGQSWSSWTARLPNPKALHWYVISKAGNTLLLAGEQGLLVRSSDGGESFQSLNSPYKGSWFAGEFSSSGQLVLAGLRGNIWRTADSGNSWEHLPSPVPATITAMATQADGSLLLASQAGVLMQLKDKSLLPLKSPSVPMPSALLPIGGDLVLSMGIAGVVPVHTEARP